MNLKKIKIILYLPLTLFFIANLFYYPLPAEAEEVCAWYQGHDCTPLGIESVSRIAKCSNASKTSAGCDILNLKPCACCCKTVTPAGTNATTPQTPAKEKPGFKPQVEIPGLEKEKPGFKPQVEIPGLEKEFTKDKTGGYILPQDTGAIAKYIRAIYKYAIGIVGILAAVVLMIGGVIWITAGGSAERIGEAKAWIASSLTGLLLALLSYTILATVNPALVDFKISEIENVKKIEKESFCCDTIKGLVSREKKTSNNFTIYKCPDGSIPFDSNFEKCTKQSDNKYAVKGITHCCQFQGTLLLAFLKSCSDGVGYTITECKKQQKADEYYSLVSDSYCSVTEPTKGQCVSNPK